MNLITITETIKKLEKRLMLGTMPTKDELSRTPALTAEALFGFNEEARRESK